MKGWIAFEKTVNYIKQNYPDQFIIADAKRGDIGHTSAMYARTFFEELDIDSVTVAPYRGEDLSLIHICYVKLTKEYKELGDLMKARKEYMQVLGGIEEAKEIIANETDQDVYKRQVFAPSRREK